MKFNILKKADEHEFKPLLIEIEEEPTSPLGRIILWLVLAAILVGAIMLFVAKIDIVVSAQGIIIPEGEIKVLQPLEGGIISKINVKAGDFVRKGDVLMEIDPSVVEPDYQSKKENLARITMEKECLEALTVGENGNCGHKELARYIQTMSNLQSQTEAKKEQIKQIEEELNSLSFQIKSYRDMLNADLELSAKLEKVKDIISFDEIKKNKDSIINLRKEIRRLEHEGLSKNHMKLQLEKELEVVHGSVMESWQKELSELTKTYSSLKAEVGQIAFRHEKQQIFSPVDGYVNVLFINTVGGVATAAQQLISVVPVGAKLLAKAQVLNKDVGFIMAGQDCVIKMETFDFQKYGKIAGKVLHVSADSIDNEKLGRVYEVYVEPENLIVMVDGKETRITSGMNLTAEVKVGKRRVIEFFIYPMIRYLDEGLSVR